MTYAAADTFRLGDVFSRAIPIYRRRFGLFFALTLIAYIPQYFFEFVIAASDIPASPANIDGGIMLIRIILIVLLFLICSWLAQAAVIYGVVQELRGREFTLAGSLEVALRRFLPMLGAAICITFLTGLAMILLLVPAFMVACAYYVTIPVCIAEQSGVFDSMSRSTYLTKGYRWQIFGMMALVGIGGYAVAWISERLAAATGPIGVLIVTNGAAAVISAFSAVLVGVLYYQLRVAKDGVDIDRIASVFD
jgi:uncharacterized membrane protein